MSTALISTEALERALSLRDLMDERQGPHAMQLILKRAHEALAGKWGCRRLVYRSCPIVSVTDNYDSLGYPPGGASRDARYTRYVSPSMLLRTQASASIPTLLRSLAADVPEDILLVCPALCYRRDVIDRIHVGEPHQLDIWRVSTAPLAEPDLREMIATLVSELLPGRAYRLLPASHPYTTPGYQIDVADGSEWIEIGECGVAHPGTLARAGLDPAKTSGLAMGIGLDRILMLRKGIPDIRLLRSDDPRVAAQMLDLGPYRAVSKLPAIPRDLSIAIDENLGAEEMGDIVRSALGEEVLSLEDMLLLSQTPYAELPRAAHERMGMKPGQKNVLLRLVIRHPTRTLTSEEANLLRDRVYLELHQGDKKEMAAG
jgi:phenylalanyl-tRNA synthetase alpha chain